MNKKIIFSVLCLQFIVLLTIIPSALTSTENRTSKFKRIKLRNWESSIMEKIHKKLATMGSEHFKFHLPNCSKVRFLFNYIPPYEVTVFGGGTMTISRVIYSQAFSEDNKEYNHIYIPTRCKSHDSHNRFE